MSLHVGDIGAVIRLTVYEDGSPKNISSAVPKQLKIRKPDGSVTTKTASFSTDGTNGQLQCVTDISDLDQEGRYTVSAYMTIGSWTGYTSPATFSVEIAP
jgi:hypothetical protein